MKSVKQREVYEVATQISNTAGLSSPSESTTRQTDITVD